MKKEMNYYSIYIFDWIGRNLTDTEKRAEQ